MAEPSAIGLPIHRAHRMGLISERLIVASWLRREAAYIEAGMHRSDYGEDQMSGLREKIANALYGEFASPPSEETHPFDKRWYDAADVVLEAMDTDPGHDATAGLVEPGQDRTRVVTIYRDIIRGALREQVAENENCSDGGSAF